MLASLALACAMAAIAAPARATGFVDVLAQPAVMSPLASKGLLQGVARAGDTLVAVGQRGHIVRSADGGKTWQQSPSPVSSDLTAVTFVNERAGWAVGHDGVILATRDGGATWTLQLDGKRANAAVLADVTRKAAAQGASEAMKALVAEAQRNAELGADKPFLDVWFADENTGYAVGAYNLLFRTDDGGKTWASWFDRTDNPKFLNLYGVRPAAGSVFIVGEGGLVLKLDAAGQRFRAVEVPYQGTLLGLAADGERVVVFGLRGNAFRSSDAGASWAKVDSMLPATIVAGAALPGNRMVLGDVSGRVVLSADGGSTFAPLPIANPMMLAGLADAGDGRLALVGARGANVVPLPGR
jgi:photosystem II stability/assembly factor-like uncharacterized protein